MINNGEFNALSKQWQKELELKAIGDEQVSPEHTAKAISNFITNNKATFEDIESFIHILHDWIEETQASILSEGSTSQKSNSMLEGGQSESDADYMLEGGQPETT